MIEIIPTFDGRSYVEWTRSFNGILQKTWQFLSKIVSELERPEPIPGENRGGEENTADFGLGETVTDERLTTIILNTFVSRRDVLHN